MTGTGIPKKPFFIIKKKIKFKFAVGSAVVMKLLGKRSGKKIKPVSPLNHQTIPSPVRSSVTLSC